MSRFDQDVAKYPWGRIVRIHYVGEYQIIESKPWKRDGCTVLSNQVDEFADHEFHPYLNETDAHESYESLDAALAGIIAYKHEGCNHRANRYFMKMIAKEG